MRNENPIRRGDPAVRPEDYSPRTRPAILDFAAAARAGMPRETLVEQPGEWCAIVDRTATRIVGIGVQITYESRGYAYNGTDRMNDALNDARFTMKLIEEGEIDLLGDLLGIPRADRRYTSARYDVRGDGDYRVIAGLEVTGDLELPAELPEHTAELVVPAGRFARLSINGKARPDRSGYAERMHADEYFVSAFRRDTPYVYDTAGLPMNTYDDTGDMLMKYEPVKVPADIAERYDSLRYRPVVLPPMKIACAISEPGRDDEVIGRYFEVENEVYKCPAARYYMQDYYGFPVDTGTPGEYRSCFGTRVSSWEGLPAGVERRDLPGGLYLHISQIEVNGDNPSIPYEVAFGHLRELYLDAHPEYAWDSTRKVIARFRHANCASVFVPLSRT